MTSHDALTLTVLTLVALCVGCLAVPAVAALSDRWQVRRARNPRGYSVQQVAVRRRLLDELHAEPYTGTDGARQ